MHLPAPATLLLATQLVLLRCPAMAAPDPAELTGYRRLKPSVERVRVENPDFNAGISGWSLPEGFERDAGGGRDGSGALKFTRSDPASYLLATQHLDLIPGGRYRFGVWVRSEGVIGDDMGATICLEFYEGSRYHSGEYPWGTRGTSGWTRIEQEVTVPLSATRCLLVLYLRQGMTGTAWFDDVTLIPESPAWSAYLISPSHDTLDPANGRCVIRSVLSGNLAGQVGPIPDSELACRVEVAPRGRPAIRVLRPVRDRRIPLELGALPPGELGLHLTLADTRRKWILGDVQLRLRVAASSTQTGACRIDEHGRAIVDGAPFLPVGLYCAGLSRDDLTRLGASPFNCVMPYQSLDLRLDGSALPGVDAVRETLDACAARGLKMIFSLKDVYAGTFREQTSFAGATGEAAVIAKAVGAFKDHPALLAWYVNDERPLTMQDRLIARRREVNRLDPAHPTWAVLYQFDQLDAYGATCDVLGVDPYPIKNDSSRDMGLVLRAVDNAARATSNGNGMALWVVPQIFNQGAYEIADPAALHRAYRDPAEAEMRAMSLLCAIRGATGFVFYSYFDLLAPATRPDFDRRWPEICRVGQLLRDLAPFLLSARTTDQPAVEDAAGVVVARAFTDSHGRIKILIAGVGPDDQRATLRVSGTTPLRSRYGLTTTREPGVYRFTGRDICADILEE